LEAIEEDVEMASTKRLQERYQWKADQKTGTLEAKDAPIHTSEKPTASPTGKSLFLK
jgi:hypothetical protein